MEKYDKDFIQKVSDLAVLGLYPSQIASRLGLLGKEREQFLEDIRAPLPVSELALAYAKSFQQSDEDLDAALATSCLCGDAKALKVAYEVGKQRSVDELKLELFGI